MKHMKRQLLLLASTAPLMLTPIAAQAADGSGGVFGLGASRDQSNIGEFIEKEGGPPMESADSAWGANLYVGYAFNRYVTLRFGQRFLGGGEADSSSGASTVKIDGDGIYLAADLMWPVTDRFAIGGTFGNQSIDADIEVEQSGFFGSTSRTVSEDARDFYYGVRARWTLGETASFIASYNLYSFEVDDASEDIEFDSLGLGFEWRF